MFASLSACDGGPEPSSGETDADNASADETTRGATTDAAQPEDGPVIVSLELRDEALDAETPVTELVAQVGHSDDLGELVGGLVRRQGQLVGAMLQISEGTYSFGMTRELLNPSESPNDVLVELEVEFTDRNGRAVNQMLAVPICHGTTTRCEAGCFDLDRNEDNCGGCGNACTDGFICAYGGCRYDYDDPYYSDSGYDHEVAAPQAAEELAGHAAAHGEPGLHLPIPLAPPRPEDPLDVSAFNLAQPGKR